MGSGIGCLRRNNRRCDRLSLHFQGYGCLRCYRLSLRLQGYSCLLIRSTDPKRTRRFHIKPGSILFLGFWVSTFCLFTISFILVFNILSLRPLGPPASPGILGIRRDLQSEVVGSGACEGTTDDAIGLAFTFKGTAAVKCEVPFRRELNAFTLDLVAYFFLPFGFRPFAFPLSSSYSLSSYCSVRFLFRPAVLPVAPARPLVSPGISGICRDLIKSIIVFIYCHSVPVST